MNSSKTKSTPSEFALKVIACIGKIPEGRVATYSQIAGLAGKPHAARGVSWILHSSSKAHRLPWQRVIGSKGAISFPKGSAHFREQKRLLMKEGVLFLEDGTIDLVKWQWTRKPKAPKSLAQKKLAARRKLVP